MQILLKRLGVLAWLVLGLSGCKILIEVPEGGKVVHGVPRAFCTVDQHAGDAVDVGVDELVVEADEPCDCEGLMAGNGVGPCDVVNDSFADLC